MPFKISDDFSKNVILILDMSKNAWTPGAAFLNKFYNLLYHLFDLFI